MKLIKASVEIMDQEDMFKHIERAGRTCYKSEDKITEDSAQRFVEQIKERKHTAMLEHGAVYLHIGNLPGIQYLQDLNFYEKNKYTTFNILDEPGMMGREFFITTNYRVLVENGREEDLEEYGCKPTKHHEKRTTVKFICDRGVSHELVRHRVFSFAQESTRYCNYGSDKFGQSCTFIQPSWFGEDWKRMREEGKLLNTDKITNAESTWADLIIKSEQAYFDLLREGWLPQQARAVLPNSLKTEVIMTGFESDWKEFFKLRIPPTAHPQMRELSIPLLEMFKERYEGFDNIDFQTT